VSKVAATKSKLVCKTTIVIAGEFNYLFNPVHPAFNGFARSKPEPFVCDVRLG
jgi:hypothetical protein